MVLNIIKGLIFSCLLLGLCNEISGIIVLKDYMELSARSIGQTLAQCLGTTQKIECVEGKIMHTLEKALQDNSTWQYGDFLLLERNTAGLVNIWENNTRPAEPEQRSISDRMGDRLLQLAQSRSLRLKLPPISDLVNLQAYGVGISNAVDDFAAAGEAVNVGAAPIGNEGMQRLLIGLGLDDKIAKIYAGRKSEKKKIKNKIWYLNKPIKKLLKGRKKKDKDKHMAMMGGMTIVAMLAQMFLGKVILIAGAAFVMAKIALLISVLGSLKNKGQMGGGGGTEHVIVTGGGGGHSHDSSGWHRSMPYEYAKVEEISSNHDDHEDHGNMAHDEPHTSTYETTDNAGWTGGWHRRSDNVQANIQTELDSERKVDAEKSQHSNIYINHRVIETRDQLGSQKNQNL